MAAPWTPRSSRRWWACATACEAPAEVCWWRPCPARETGLRLSSRDPEQYRDELVDLAHLVEEVIRAGLHAALAHRGQVVVGEHDDPYVPAVLGVLVACPCLTDHPDAAARTQLHVHDDGVVGHAVQLLDRLGLGRCQ